MLLEKNLYKHIYAIYIMLWTMPLSFNKNSWWTHLKEFHMLTYNSFSFSDKQDALGFGLEIVTNASCYFLVEI